MAIISDNDKTILYSKYQRHFSKVKETVIEQLEAIFKRVAELNPIRDNAYNGVMSELEKHGVEQVNFKMLSKSEENYLKLYFTTENPKEVLTIKDLQTKFLVSPTTAKTDVVGLLKRGLLSEIAFNKVKRGYIKGEKLDDLINQL